MTISIHNPLTILTVLVKMTKLNKIYEYLNQNENKNK